MLYAVEVVGDATTLEGGISLSKEEVSKYLRPSFAQTYHSSQGLTLEGKVKLSCSRLMGLNRARGAELVQVCD